ncbi:hypothetical protein [Paracidovorax anthurii]|uniref:Uncharacterized protein n=1 Tax=Paracidovorax anthurii TaxID=78229 RepID=A0A328ZKD0_9BURK|nr:hypothetical protein [Paracidovorax anthurii]RAR85815.1 hypothetical protein AX018_100343 [Paracidovorax anthurii]
MKTTTITTTPEAARAPSLPVLQAALDASIEAAYHVFGACRAPAGLLDVCTACCMDAALEREMRRLPLRTLTARHFYQYNDSVKSTVQPADEIKYLLPRLLELLAQGAQLHHSTELSLDRVGRCEPGAFNGRERQALQDVALAHFALGLEQWAEPDQGVFRKEDAFTVLLMWDHAGVDLAPLLEHWLACESNSSALHYVDASYWGFVLNGHQVGGPFSKDRPRYREAVEHWLTAPTHRDRFTARLLQMMDRCPTGGWLPPGTQECDCRSTLNERIGAVFDTMAR